MADAFLEPTYEPDGVTILGGNPLAQPQAGAALIALLRQWDWQDIGISTGFTLAVLRRRSWHGPAIATVLAGVSWLTDGPYVAAQADHAPAWRGSRNQRSWHQGGGGMFVEDMGRFGD